MKILQLGGWSNIATRALQERTNDVSRLQHLKENF